MSLESFLEPTDIDQVCDLLEADPWGTKVISGGTAVTLMMRQGLIAPDSLVSISNITSMHGISEAESCLTIGATTTLTEIARSPLVRMYAPGVATACSLVGNPRIRNVATIGGNLAEADYASDPPAALASYSAECHVVGHNGTRVVPVIDLIRGFYETVLEPSEVVTRVDIPLPKSEQHGTYLKYRSRSSEDRACVGVAARVDFDDGIVTDLMVVVAAVAPTLQSVANVLMSVRGMPLDPDTIESVAAAYADEIEPMDDARGSAWYRSRMIKVFVKRALEELSDAQQTLGVDQRG